MINSTNHHIEASYRLPTPQPAARTAQVRGFTVVELAVTLAVGAILLALAIPSLSSYVRSTRVVSEANGFVGALNRARAEALIQLGNVRLCASNTATTCSGTWNDGWILFNDCDTDGVPDLATATCDTDGDGTAETNETLIRIGNPSTGTNNTASGGSFIVYEADGSVSAGVGTFTVCVSGHDTGSLIDVNAQGRIRTNEVGCP